MKTLIFSFLMLFAFTAFSQNSGGLEIGDKVPDFKATADDGSTWSIKNNIGNKYLVVYFFPAAMTGGCTKQACAYRDLHSDIESADATVVGVSGDSADGLENFKKAYNLNFTLLSDESGKIAEIFGVPTREGGEVTREVNGITYNLQRGSTASRWTYIIDKDGKVVYKNENVDASIDSDQVLSFLKNNS